jgi:hypothetical protein
MSMNFGALMAARWACQAPVAPPHRQLHVPPIDVLGLFAIGVGLHEKLACVSKLMMIARLKTVEHAQEDFAFVLMDLLEILVAAVTLDTPQTKR